MIQDTGGVRVRRGGWTSWAHDSRTEAIVLSGGYDTGVRDTVRRLQLSAQIAEAGELGEGVAVEVEGRDGSWETLVLVDPEEISDGALIRYGVRPEGSYV